MKRNTIVIALTFLSLVAGLPSKSWSQVVSSFNARVIFRDGSVHQVEGARFLYRWSFKSENDKYVNPRVFDKQSPNFQFLEKVRGVVEVGRVESPSVLDRIRFAWNGERGSLPLDIVIVYKDGRTVKFGSFVIPTNSAFLQDKELATIIDPSVLYEVKLEGFETIDGSKGKFSTQLNYKVGPDPAEAIQEIVFVAE